MAEDKKSLAGRALGWAKKIVTPSVVAGLTLTSAAAPASASSAASTPKPPGTSVLHTSAEGKTHAPGSSEVAGAAIIVGKDGAVRATTITNGGETKEVLSPFNGASAFQRARALVKGIADHNEKPMQLLAVDGNLGAGTTDS